MEHPPAVVEKAHRTEELLQRVAKGERLAEVCADLGLIIVTEEQLRALQKKYEAGGRTWEALLDGRYGHSQKAHSALRAWLYERRQEDENLRAPQLAKEIETKFQVKLSAGHVNYLLRKVELTASPGRPYKSPTEQETVSPPTEKIDQAGIFFPGSREARDRGHGDSGS